MLAAMPRGFPHYTAYQRKQEPACAQALGSSAALTAPPTQNTAKLHVGERLPAGLNSRHHRHHCSSVQLHAQHIHLAPQPFVQTWHQSELLCRFRTSIRHPFRDAIAWHHFTPKCAPHTRAQPHANLHFQCSTIFTPTPNSEPFLSCKRSFAVYFAAPCSHICSLPL